MKAGNCVEGKEHGHVACLDGVLTVWRLWSAISGVGETA